MTDFLTAAFCKFVALTDLAELKARIASTPDAVPPNIQQGLCSPKPEQCCTLSGTRQCMHRALRKRGQRHPGQQTEYSNLPCQQVVQTAALRQAIQRLRHRVGDQTHGIDQ